MTDWQPSARARERQAFRRAQHRRALAVATVATVVVVAAVAYVVATAPGWERARTAFFSPERAVEVLPEVAEGLWLNLRVWVVASVVGLVVGLLLAVVRTSRLPALFPLRVLTVLYVDVFRGVPVLLVLLLAGFGLPALRLEWLPVSAAFLGGLAIVLTYTAYLAEIFRAGIESVHPSQVAAARSLGLTRGQTVRRVVLPQAVRNVTAPTASTLVSLQKDSGLISILGAVDAIRAAQIATTGDYNFTPYVVAGVLFLLLSIPLTRLVDAWSARQGWRGRLRGVSGAGVIR
ncbi:amino acid ABC transporter membrane protein (PAAT family) [Isoptericola sp. CG 20/1183]|uniref:Amino acid ABC transporter membrane protein (PAAT family) n=1 Tax=Isoptericola halotolerans TaxID=300560 RepID=A0ABX5EF91_9MICO|nr:MULTISPECIES: ABC transporter permease subunit [Isoptericola]MCK0118878.1 ABC transporter permease subunit [Isoptericola sp. S6320L]PRZ07818.1 amino acid ABC transporter membrane protein (PAAT family) [Isoptericola halotolerans]PRZ07823.1 amino acid ABC transporter membrane protein (PAAT family) [Isoptericola sp. CG 20/1183]